ncbi:hypothetical protein [Jannaschia formosa]|uniref:hypothetical protein n=1 Tax=Jannaschia formosa TaxID=2259592 RepID=UPI000E1B633F|nr:hypothetical protein [Jannaschia formosa]TFL20141.1 hypothetical protein DR046_01985 [Jannaschia formosa]
MSAPGLRLVPAPAGLDVAGSGGREIGFGRDRAGALASVARVEGASPRAVACPAPGLDAFRTEGGLVLVFTGTSFVGWAQDGARAGRGC